jgi:hypothetical protein
MTAVGKAKNAAKVFKYGAETFLLVADVRKKYADQW